MRPRWLWAVPAVVALAIFWPVLALPLTGDDYMIVALANDHAWADLFNPSANWYHFVPGALAGWKLTIALVGYNATAWHAISLVLYAATAVACVAVLRALGRAPVEAFLGGAFFAAFFANYETIAFAGTGICYHSALLCYLSAVLLYHRFQRSGRRSTYALFILAATLAIVTFDVAILILPTVALLEYVEGGLPGLRVHWKRYIVPALLVGVYWFAGGQVAASALPATPSLVAMVKKLLIDLAYLSSFNQTWFRELFFASYAVRIVWTMVIAGAIALLLLRGSRSTQALVVWAVMHMVPFTLMTGHQPRYFLFSAVATVGLWAAAVGWLMTRAAGDRRAAQIQRAAVALIALAIVIGGAAFSRNRLRSWADAGRISEEMHGLVVRELATHSPAPDFLLVDFPAMHGAYHDVYWPPFLFLSAFQDGRFFRTVGSGAVPDTVRLVRTRSLDAKRPSIASDSMDDATVALLAADPERIVVRYDSATGLQRIRP